MDFIITQLIAAFVATISAAITLEAPRKLIFKAGYAGIIGYFVYLMLLNYVSQVVATLIACIAVSLAGQYFARRYHAPVTIFYIPAFFLFVPGSAIYQTAFHFIQGNTTLSLEYFFQTMLIAGAIALGVFITDSMLETYHHIKQFRIRRKEL